MTQLHDHASTNISQHFLYSTLDALSARIAILDETGSIIAVNKAWRDFAGANDAKPDAMVEGADYLHACDAAEGEAAERAKVFGSGIRDVIHGRIAFFEKEYPFHDDTHERWFLGRVTPFPENEIPRKVVVSHVNITDRVKAVREKERLKEQLRNAQKFEAIGMLVGGIAHDFNNILCAVTGYTDLILEQIDAYPEIREDMEEVAKAGRHARDLVAKLLAFSRQAKAEAAPVQVFLIVKEALKMLRAALPSSIEIEQEILSFGEVLADPGQIHQIIMNLCTNANQAMREKGGILSIRLEEVDVDRHTAHKHSDIAPGAYMCLKVSDTGIGMDASTKCRIFDPYFTTKEKGEGSGLGLSVVYGIVKAYGGSVTVDSRPGEGAAFTVLLPLLKHAETIEPREAEIPKASGDARILFIDDEPVMLKMIKRMLGNVGYRVDVSSSSTEALDHFKKNPDQYDMVISDMTMPGLTGDQLVMEILRIRPELPVILCTGFNDRIDKKDPEVIGARSLVMKPFDRHELISAVRKALGGQGNATPNRSTPEP